jgi:hypothetical protein
MRFSAFHPRATALTITLVALSLAGGAAVAQTPPAPPAASTEPAHSHTRMTLKERFAQANTTNDGHLTMEQAKAGLPRVAKNFTVIDKDNKGYVTLTDIQDYYKAQRAARRQTPASSGNG